MQYVLVPTLLYLGALLSNSCLVCVPSSSPPCSGSHVSVYCQLGSGPCIVQWLLCIHTYVHTVRRCLFCVHCSVGSGTMYIWRTYDSTVHCAVLHTTVYVCTLCNSTCALCNSRCTLCNSTQALCNSGQILLQKGP